MTRARLRRGFTLLEVMVAVAILGLGLTAIFAAQAGSFRNVSHARNVSEATGLLRCKMSEIEEGIEKDGFQITDQTEAGPCCVGFEDARMTCAWAVEKPEFPQANFGELDLESDLDFKRGGPSILGGNSPPGAAAGPAGAAMGFLNSGKSNLPKDGDVGDVADSFVGGADDISDGIASMIMQIVYPDLKAAFEAGTRKVTVRVVWQEGNREQSVEIMQWVTNSKEAGLMANVNGLLPQDEAE